MDRLSPVEIEKLLDSRLGSTIELYNDLDTTDIEIYNTIYFKLYFDFSTAIESTIANILYEKYGADAFILNKSKIDSNTVSKYIPKDEMKLLLMDFGDHITIEDIKNRFKCLDSIVKESFYKTLGISRNLYEIEAFASMYHSSRDTRNKIAHGLISINVDYSTKMLFKFMSCYYVLIEFYKTMLLPLSGGVK